jgi:tRNA (guanine37-N1)-methyltransferase
VRIDVFTIFPEVVEAYATTSILGRAQTNGLVDLRTHDLRSGASDARRTVDDTPFGGGAGMVLMPEPVFAAVEAQEGWGRPLLALSPRGTRFTQQRARTLAASAGFSLLCGRYEGIDERIVEHLVDEEVSVGDYVLAGGELAALVVVEAVTRLVPGVLGNAQSNQEESFADDLLEYPHYTRPAVFRDWPVPAALRSGDHRRIARWRRAEALKATLRQRPDLLKARGGLTAEEVELLIGHGEVRLLAEHGYDS